MAQLREAVVIFCAERGLSVPYEDNFGQVFEISAKLGGHVGPGGNIFGCKPVYEEMPGWSESTEGARSWAELPANAIKYVRRVEELIECPVALLSTSPEREDTILVRDPFAD